MIEIKNYRDLLALRNRSRCRLYHSDAGGVDKLSIIESGLELFTIVPANELTHFEEKVRPFVNKVIAPEGKRFRTFDFSKPDTWTNGQPTFEIAPPADEEWVLEEVITQVSVQAVIPVGHKIGMVVYLGNTRLAGAEYATVQELIAAGQLPFISPPDEDGHSHLSIPFRYTRPTKDDEVREVPLSGKLGMKLVIGLVGGVQPVTNTKICVASLRFTTSKLIG